MQQLAPISWWRNDLGASDIEAISRAMEQRKISQGTLSEEFEEALASFLGVPYVVVVSSGSAALLIAYMASGLGVGGRILTSNVTFVATAHAALLLGGEARSVEVDARNVMDVGKIDKSALEGVSIIVPVHMNGCAIELEGLLELARKNGVDVIEDAAQAFGSKNKQGQFLGTLGRFGCFSLGMAKILTTGTGGFIVAHSKEDALLCKKLRNHGVLDVRDNPCYNQLGFNFKFSDLHASIGLNQLSTIQTKLKRCVEIYECYVDALNDKMEFLQSDIKGGEIPMRIVALTPKNKKIMAYLASKNIQCALESTPLHGCAHLGIKGNFPKSEYFESHKLILPCGPSQSQEDICRVIDGVNEFFMKGL